MGEAISNPREMATGGLKGLTVFLDAAGKALSGREWITRT